MKKTIILALALLAAPALAEGPKVSRLPGVPSQPADIAKQKSPNGEDVINLTISRGHAPKSPSGKFMPDCIAFST